MNRNRNRIFISYSHNDKEIAQRISESLERENIDVIIDYKNLSPGDNVFDQIRYMYESSETVIVLLSKSLFQSEFARYEFPKFFFEEARKRKINIIPILVERCQIPSDFLEFEIVNLTKNFESGLNKVVQKLKIIPEISFDSAGSPRSFAVVATASRPCRCFSATSTPPGNRLRASSPTS